MKKKHTTNEKHTAWTALSIFQMIMLQPESSVRNFLRSVAAQTDTGTITIYNDSLNTDLLQHIISIWGLIK